MAHINPTIKNMNPTEVIGDLAGTSVDDYTAPLFIAWQLNAECNLDCMHCCEEAGHSIPNELNREELFDLCKQIVELNIPYVAISGGEPMLHPDFIGICEFFRSQGISLKIETNGEFIGEEMAQKFANLGFRSVQVSLDGSSAETHEQLRKGGSWEKAVAACKYLVARGVNTEIVFVPTRFNINEIGHAIDMAYSLGCYGFYTGKLMRIGRAAQNWDVLCPTDEQYEQFFKTLKDKTEAYEGKMKVYYYPYDVIEELRYRMEQPSASLLIIPNGKVKLIGPLPFICGELRKQNLSDIWEQYKKAWKEPKVVEFANKVVDDPKLLAKANDWEDVFDK